MVIRYCQPSVLVSTDGLTMAFSNRMRSMIGHHISSALPCNLIFCMPASPFLFCAASAAASARCARQYATQPLGSMASAESVVSSMVATFFQLSALTTAPSWTTMNPCVNSSNSQSTILNADAATACRICTLPRYTMMEWGGSSFDKSAEAAALFSSPVTESTACSRTFLIDFRLNSFFILLFFFLWLDPFFDGDEDGDGDVAEILSCLAASASSASC
mmetsp:Transcript_10712/g.30604  ORF Transcript_10712/g.30604 Transcript_10712/m.30604 type:complete len:218 (+) Transcript_10712:1000-1653(+)